MGLLKNMRKRSKLRVSKTPNRTSRGVSNPELTAISPAKFLKSDVSDSVPTHTEEAPVRFELPSFENIFSNSSSDIRYSEPITSPFSCPENWIEEKSLPCQENIDIILASDAPTLVLNITAEELDSTTPVRYAPVTGRTDNNQSDANKNNAANLSVSDGTMCESQLYCVDSRKSSRGNDLKTAPIKNDMKTTPIKNDMKTTLIKNDMKTTPIKNDMKTTPFHNDTKTGFLENNLKTTSLRNDLKSTSLGNGLKTALVENEPKTTAIGNNLKTTSIGNDLETTSLGNDLSTSSCNETSSFLIDEAIEIIEKHIRKEQNLDKGRDVSNSALKVPSDSVDSDSSWLDRLSPDVNGWPNASAGDHYSVKKEPWDPNECSPNVQNSCLNIENFSDLIRFNRPSIIKVAASQYPLEETKTVLPSLQSWTNTSTNTSSNSLYSSPPGGYQNIPPESCQSLSGTSGTLPGFPYYPGDTPSWTTSTGSTSTGSTAHQTQYTDSWSNWPSSNPQYDNYNYRYLVFVINYEIAISAVRSTLLNRIMK